MFRKPAYLILPSLAAASLLASAANAQVVETRGAISSFVSWESNPEKRTSNQRSNALLNFRPSVEMDVKSDIWNIGGVASATVVKSENKAIQADTKGYDVTLSGERLLETGKIDGRFVTRLEEFNNSEFDEAAALSGEEDNAANDDDTITRNNASLRYVLDFDEQLEFTFEGKANQTEFSDIARQDFLDTRMSVGARYAVDELMTVTGKAEYQRFMPDGLETTNVARLSGGIELFFEEGESLVIEPGVIRTDSTIAMTGRVTWAAIFERFTLSANASLDHEPDDNGNLDRRSREQAVFTFLLTPKTNAILTLSAEQNETVNVRSAAGRLTHDYSEFINFSANSNVSSSELKDEFLLGGRMNWTVTEDLALNFLLQETVTDAADQNDLAFSTKGQIGLTWQLP